MKMKKLILFSFTLVHVNAFNAQDIFEAARKGDTACIQAFIRTDPERINSSNEDGFTALILAVYHNQLTAVAFLLQQKANVNADSPEGTALLAACYKGNKEIAELLIQYNAEVNATNPFGTSALMYAAQSGNFELVSLLLKYGAKKELKEKSGKTALDYAKLNRSEKLITLLSF